MPRLVVTHSSGNNSGVHSHVLSLISFPLVFTYWFARQRNAQVKLNSIDIGGRPGSSQLQVELGERNERDRRRSRSIPHVHFHCHETLTVRKLLMECPFVAREPNML